MSDETLPPLPEPFVPVVYEAWADQMRAYGRACADAAIERCAQRFDIPDEISGEAEEWSRAAAVVIRALKGKACACG